MLYLLIPLAAYPIGSFSTAVLVCRLMGLPDPRAEGSRNPGATNVLRLGSKTGAALALAGDVAKGVIPVVVARGLVDDSALPALAALGAFLGHLLPIFFRFEGGKGVATAFGVLTAIDWQLGALLAGTWLAAALVFRYSSLAALITAAATPLYAWWLSGEWIYVGLGGILAVLLFLRHRQNISRLFAGTEPKIGKKS